MIIFYFQIDCNQHVLYYYHTSTRYIALILKEKNYIGYQSIKDSDKWEKGQSDKKLEGGIQGVSRKNVGSFLKWKKENRDYENTDSEFPDKCMIMQRQSIAGDKKDICYSKFIYNIARENSIHPKQIGNI